MLVSHPDIEVYARLAVDTIGARIQELMQSGETKRQIVRVCVAIADQTTFPFDPGEFLLDDWIYVNASGVSTDDQAKYALYARTKALIAIVFGKSSRKVRDILKITDFHGVKVWAGGVVITLSDGWLLAVGVSGDSEDNDEAWAIDLLNDILDRLGEVVRL